MRMAKPASILSVILVLLSIASLTFKGLNWGLDFTGGTVVEVGFQQPVALTQMRTALEANGIQGAVVQHFGSTRDILVRLAPKGGVAQQQIVV